MKSADRERELPAFPWGAAMLQPPEPPPCPRGWAVGPPDFVGVGAQRCGTTRLYALIAAHPDVQDRQPKETHYLDHLWGGGRAEPEVYARYFPRPPGHICGEWTPRYMLDPWTPARLAAVAPRTKVLVSLRDPVERYVSGLGHAAITAQIGVPVDSLTSIGHVARGQYLAQMRNLLRHFDRRRILVLQFERALADPAGEVRRLYAFLGIDPSFEPPDLSSGRQAHRLAHLELAAFERAELTAFLRPEVQELATMFPELDLDLWPNFRVSA